MKKTYMTPQMEVVEIKTTSGLLAVSGFQNTLDPTVGDGSDALAPGFDEIEMFE